MRWLTLLLTLALLVVMAWWLFQRGDAPSLDREHQLLESPQGWNPNQANPPHTNLRADADANVLTAPDAGHTAVDHQRRVESGFRVVNKEGIPLEGAIITWSPRSAAWHARVERSAERDWAGLLQRSITVSTDARGSCELPLRLDGDVESSIVWITHSAAKARSFRIPPGTSPLELDQPIQLERAGSIEVQVVDAEGRPVSNAVVRTTRTLLPRLRGRRPVEEIEDSLYLVRFATADGAGRVTVPSLDDLQTVIASAGTQISDAWRGEASASVTLTLRPSFEVRGRVRALDDSQRFEDVVVSVLARTGAETRGVSGYSVDAQGAFGPQLLPILAGALYDFHAQGGEYIATRKTIDSPEPDSRQYIEISMEVGSTFPVLVVDPEDAPIPGANVDYIWQAGDLWQRALVVAGQDGVARMRGSPLGSIWLDIEARGFVPKREGLLLETPVTDPWRVKLERGGTIEGVVRHADVPVETFSIKSWRGSVEGRNSQHFLGRPEGRFTIEGVPLGEISIFASSNELGRGPVQTVTVAQAVPAWVDLELAGCVSALGRVVDGMTGEPISGAVVQPWLVQSGSMLEPFGRRGITDDQGSFQLECIPSGDGSLSISAEGFPERSLATTAPNMTPLNVGTISLRRAASLDLKLILAQATRVDGWFGSLDGPNSIAPQHFPADGVLRFENLEPGHWMYTVHAPDRSGRYGEVDLLPSKRSSVEVRTTATGNVRVEIHEKPGHPLKEPGTLYVIPDMVASGSARCSQSFLVPPSRSQVCEIDPRFPHQLLLLDGDQRTVASLLVPVSLKAPAVLVLETGGPSAHVVVVDRLGDPLGGVALNLDGGSASAVRHAISDARGLTDFGPWPYPAANLHLQRDDVGVGYVRGVELKSHEATRIEFDPQAELEVLALDGSTSLPGVEVRVLAPRIGEHWLTAMTTDSAGRARSRKLLPGDYILAADGESLWPVRRTLRMGTSTHTETLQIRRRGSIAFQVMRGGLPLSDVYIQIHSVEFDENASDWLARDLIMARPPNAETDSDGRLRLDGLPRGVYQWSVTAPDESVRTGEAEIAPGSCLQVRIDLD